MCRSSERYEGLIHEKKEEKKLSVKSLNSMRSFTDNQCNSMSAGVIWEHFLVRGSHVNVVNIGCTLCDEGKIDTRGLGRKG